MGIRRAVVVSETTAEQDLVIGLDHERSDEAVRAKTEVDRWIDAAIDIHSGDAVTRDTIRGSELSANEDFIVLLKSQGQNGVAGAGPRIEVGVGGTIGIEARDAASGDPIHIGEQTSEHDLFVCLQQN